MEFCVICGNINTEEHHLIYGNSYRKLADQDKLTVRLCHDCHRFIHDNGRAGIMSKMLGQLMYESKNGSRADFVKRYGRAWL